VSARDSEAFARALRLDALEMTRRAASGHIGSMYSIADLIAVLYQRVLRVDPAEPFWAERDRFILSKGHAGAILFAALSQQGFFPRSWLESYYQDGTRLGGHVSHKGVPGVELSTGSLGQGLGFACGLALAGKLDASPSHHYVLMSDGEQNEGAVWEAALFAAHWRLSNLTAIIDFNNLQSLDSTDATLSLQPLAAKYAAFGWEVIEIDGHDHPAIEAALRRRHAERPVLVVARTTKGKGVSFMEGQVLWHYRSPQGEEYARARAELDHA
jgi:transketolase